ncbi:MAG: hypothetical protein P4M05_01525 [Bradyrhizobium sp.]|nr:hypothetical protein [Bradyrhizobium sp.]
MTTKTDAARTITDPMLGEREHLSICERTGMGIVAALRMETSIGILWLDQPGANHG